MATQCPPFLLQHFQAIAASEGIYDYIVEHSAGSKHGDGFMADMMAVKLKGSHLNKSGKPVPKQLSLICKLLPSNEARREMFSSQLAFDREVLFYNELLPLLQQLQQHHGLSKPDSFFGYPRCYAAVGGSQEAVIIMQDLRADGFALWNKFDTIDLERVQLFMVQLGRLHGLSFVIRDQHPDWFERIRSLEDIMLPICKKPSLFDKFMNTFDQAIDLLSDTEHKQMLQRVRDSWTDLIAECTDKLLAEPFAVMGHGDCWNNNMMWRESKVGLCKFVFVCLLNHLT